MLCAYNQVALSSISEYYGMSLIRVNQLIKLSRVPIFMATQGSKKIGFKNLLGFMGTTQCLVIKRQERRYKPTP